MSNHVLSKSQQIVCAHRYFTRRVFLMGPLRHVQLCDFPTKLLAVSWLIAWRSLANTSGPGRDHMDKQKPTDEQIEHVLNMLPPEG